MFTFAPQKNKHRNIMQENLVIVESPAKAKTIEKFLGKDYKVMSSYGHIRDLKKKEISIDLDTLMPVYEIPDEKKRVVNDLKANAKNAKKVWLASDEDRGWHPMRTAKERLSHGTFARFSDLTRRRQAESCSMRLRRMLFLRLFSIHVSWI